MTTKAGHPRELHMHPIESELLQKRDNWPASRESRSVSVVSTNPNLPSPAIRKQLLQGCRMSVIPLYLGVHVGAIRGHAVLPRILAQRCGSCRDPSERIVWL